MLLIAGLAVLGVAALAAYVLTEGGDGGKEWDGE